MLFLNKLDVCSTKLRAEVYVVLFLVIISEQKSNTMSFTLFDKLTNFFKFSIGEFPISPWISTLSGRVKLEIADVL